MKETFILRKENRASVNQMDDESAGALFKAILAFADGEEVDLEWAPLGARLLFPLIAQQIERADKAYQETCEKRAEAGQKGGLARASKAKQSQANESKVNHNEPEPDVDPENDIKRKAPMEPKEKRERFTPPTADEVRDYAREKGLRLDADRFVYFYASKGWKVGSSPMKDWKAAVRNWAARDKVESPPNTSRPSASNPIFERERAIKADKELFKTDYGDLSKVDYSKLLWKGDTG